MQPDGLFEATESLFQALKSWSESLHQERGISIAGRGVLELLWLNGPATVPTVARERGVSRQHVQQQVDMLLARDLVERQGNPAHKRSLIVALTDKGRAIVQDMRADELEALSRLQVGVSDHANREAARVLSAWSAALRRDMASRL
jgi:DNA-binding MarR family transcriptional regulator